MSVKKILRIVLIGIVVVFIGSILTGVKNNIYYFKINSKGIYENYIKRICDIIIAVTFLILLFPIMIIVALLIRLNLGSPVIFKQERPGKDGKPFYLYKFRTMKYAVDENGKKLSDKERYKRIVEKGESTAVSDAERLTKLGTILRKYSIDELPELFNVIKGEMSIIGPRPLLMIYFPYYTSEEQHRHDVLPGLTGLAQINGRNTISWEERFKYDLEYVENITFLNDFKILLKTVLVVLKHDDIAQGMEMPEAFHVVRQREHENVSVYLKESDYEKRNR